MQLYTRNVKLYDLGITIEDFVTLNIGVSTAETFTEAVTVLKLTPKRRIHRTNHEMVICHRKYIFDSPFNIETKIKLGN